MDWYRAVLFLHLLSLFVGGMCGPRTPSYGGDPAGVFSWRPPTAMIEELSDLLDGRRIAEGQ